MLTRRRIIASPVAAAAWAAVARFGITPARADETVVRHNVATPEGKAMLRTYAQGVKILKAASSRLPLSWTFQWYIHASPASKTAEIRRVYGRQGGANRALAQAVWYTCQAHVSPPENEAYFLPWHRLYLGYFEGIIRAVTKTPSFTLPYWDYTNPSSAALPEEFQAKFAHDPVFGSLYVAHRNKDDGQQFADVNAGEPLNKYLKGADNFLNLSDATARAYSGDTGFNQRLDSNLHGNIHVFVGDNSNMASIPSAAGDPIFWLHHCNIDRIWYAWTKGGRTNPTDAAWLDKSFTFADGQGKRASATVRSIVDLGTLPYMYDALPVLPGATAPLIAMAPRAVAPGAEAPPASPPATTSSATTSAEATPSAAAPPPAPPPAAAQATQVAQGQATARVAAPIALGGSATAVTLTPVAPELALHAMAAGAATDANQRFFLNLRGVQAEAVPGTVYRVYIDLPANAAADVANDHFVGLLNFFDKVMPGPHAQMAGGKNVAFDITEVVQKLHLRDALGSDTTVTLVPAGKSNAAALPVIKDGIEIRRE